MVPVGARGLSFLLFPVALLFLCAPAAGGQESMDDLFNDPDAGIIEEDEPSGDDEGSDEDGAESGADIDALTTSPLRISGSASADAGLNLGLIEWPGSDAAGDREVSDLLRASGVYDMSSTLRFDARPRPYLRYHASFSVDLNEDDLEFVGPTPDSVFIDYTLGEVFIRGGKQGMTWGQSRLLGEPANLVDDVSSGVSLKASAPLWRGSTTAVVYSKSSYVSSGRAGSPSSFAYAALAENTFGPLTLEVSGRFKYEEPAQNAASATIGVGPVDVTAEGGMAWDYEDPQAGPSDWGALGQLYWESSGGDWRVVTEYEYEERGEAEGAHFGALGLEMPSFGGAPWTPRLQWRHAFEDDSGEVIPAVSGTIAPSLKLTFSSPVLYGVPGSYYRGYVPDEDDEDAETRAFLGSEVVQALVGVSLSFSF